MLSRRVWLHAAGVAATTGVLGGCTLNPDQDHDGPHAPRARPLNHPSRVAWVFSSGGPQGFVHVGVIKALVELGLKPDLIVGASAGAVVGSLLAAGLSPPDLERLALDMQPWSLARWAVGTPERLSGAAVADLMREHTPVRLLEDLAVPMACVAERQRDGEAIAFTAGDLGLAVQASAAIEGQFAPVRIRGERFVDPDWTMPMPMPMPLPLPLPVRLARALGAQKVLAVDATAHVGSPPPGSARYRESDLRKQALADVDGVLADVLLKPDFGYWVSLSREFRERAIGAGYRDTLAQADRLLALHAVSYTLGQHTRVTHPGGVFRPAPRSGLPGAVAVDR
jgi:NTE family protein